MVSVGRDSAGKGSQQLLNLFWILVCRTITQSGIGDFQSVFSASYRENDISCHARSQFQLGILHIDNHIVDHYVGRSTARATGGGGRGTGTRAGQFGAQANFRNPSLKGLGGKSVHAELGIGLF